MKWFNKNNNNQNLIKNDITTIQKTYYVAKDGSHFEDREKCELKNHYLNFKMYNKDLEIVTNINECYYFLIKSEQDIKAIEMFGAFKMFEAIMENEYGLGLYIRNTSLTSAYREFINITQKRKQYARIEAEFLSKIN